MPVSPPSNEPKSFEVLFWSLGPSFSPEELHEARPSATLDDAPPKPAPSLTPADGELYTSTFQQITGTCAQTLIV